jgi:broad specificity phosphatase PhoE
VTSCGVAFVRYLTHPEVLVDPTVPVPAWRLSDRGRARWAVLLARPWVRGVTRVVSSPERKALEAAGALAELLGLDVEVRAATGELDRSATGFLEPADHERHADACFAAPDRSAGGWERAVDAQARIVAALDDLLAPEAADGDVAVIGHGGVGTLWWCHLAGRPIGRRWDQPGQGHLVTVERGSRTVCHHWLPIEAEPPL